MMEECSDHHDTMNLLSSDYIQINGQDAFEQGDLGSSIQSTKEDCQSLCDSNPSCNAFAFSNSTETPINCYLKQLQQGMLPIL